LHVQPFLFAAMCVVWGLTWIAIRTGVAAVPPLFFAGTRFVAAGALMLGWHALRGGRLAFPAAALPGFAVVALLMIVLSYAGLFWGLRFVASGLAAVVNLGLMPLALFAGGLAFGSERFSWRQTFAALLGLGGLVLLFDPALRGDGAERWGLAAIVGGTLAYSIGSVVSRPLVARYAPMLVAGHTCLAGGIGLTALALALEPVGVATLAAFADPGVAAGWLFLVVFGSLVGFTIYLVLVRDWGASRAGLYAFVSPIIAVAVGVGVSGERFRARELAGMAVMLAATWIALRGRRFDRTAERR